MVIINRSKTVGNISNSLLTFYALGVGAIVFLWKIIMSDIDITVGIDKIIEQLYYTSLDLLFFQQLFLLQLWL